MIDFHVVPEALRANVRELHEVAEAWAAAKSTLAHQHLATDDLGYLGEQEDVVSMYNDALDTILDRLQSGFESLNNAVDTLKDIADEYESRDADYFAEFGYINSRLDSEGETR
ncbi:DNA repair ATPase RecN [Actinoalloteichus hoggarensis]|uniref:Uncharacterized protein n=1 Tax=Actinoalloteichus hoggarensis TaxID=1470176 RepID=A0A221W776_9PSEU|nr:hypothetical protein [Actinoalloteichus hoggarensis]ASO21217.1 hypothetical protein AHOG_17960 [Actinoalloteichus hoggarensis]MBB5921147.1 DNA repair ATPase RecN [Actinoalloteichus hoggarensis]